MDQTGHDQDAQDSRANDASTAGAATEQPDKIPPAGASSKEHDGETVPPPPADNPPVFSNSEMTVTVEEVRVRAADLIESRERHARMLAQVLPDKRRRAVEFLQEMFPHAEADEFRKAIALNPESWWAVRYGGMPEINYPGVSFHHTGGRAIRNALRQAGMDEAWFGVGNLDDYYIGLLELAVMGEDYYTDIVHLP